MSTLRTAFAALLAGAALAAAPTAALADHGEPLADPVLTRYLEVAGGHWGGTAPTCSHPDGSIVQAHVVLYDDPQPEVSAKAELPGCRIWLDRDFWRPPLAPDETDCTVIVHEWGHLLGHPHSDDRGNVMAPAPISGAPGCSFAAAAAQARPAGAPATQTAKSRRVKRAAKRRAARASARRRAARRALGRALKRRCARRARPRACIERGLRRDARRRAARRKRAVVRRTRPVARRAVVRD